MRNYTKLVAGVLMVTVLSLFAPTLRADETQGATGVITKIDEKSIEIKTAKGETQTLAIDANTHFGTKNEPLKASDLKAGDSVSVHYAKSDKGELVAKSIHKAKAKAAQTK